MSAVDIITELMGYTYDPSSMYTVPGETVMGDTYEEYHVDASALYDLIIQIFYQEVTEQFVQAMRTFYLVSRQNPLETGLI